MIKLSNKQIIEVGDWDELVIETYGKPYSFQQQEGCLGKGLVDLEIPSEYEMDEEMSDDIPDNEVNGDEMGVKFATWLARDPKQELKKDKDPGSIDMFWKRNFYPDIYTLANDMYKKGLISAGDYYINIDW